MELIFLLMFICVQYLPRTKNKGIYNERTPYQHFYILEIKTTHTVPTSSSNIVNCYRSCPAFPYQKFFYQNLDIFIFLMK